MLGLAIALGTWIDPGLWGRVLGLSGGRPTEAAESESAVASSTWTFENEHKGLVLSNTMRDGACGVRSVDLDAAFYDDWLPSYDIVEGADLNWMLCETGTGSGFPNMDKCASTAGCEWAGDVSMPTNTAFTVASRDQASTPEDCHHAAVETERPPRAESDNAR